jgi:hypothetical protein
MGSPFAILPDAALGLFKPNPTVHLLHALDNGQLSLRKVHASPA